MQRRADWFPQNWSALGWTAAEQILEAETRFFSRSWRLVRSFGDHESARPTLDFCRSPGVSLKPYPSGSLTHPAMTELARLIAVNNIQAAERSES